MNPLSRARLVAVLAVSLVVLLTSPLAAAPPARDLIDRQYEQAKADLAAGNQVSALDSFRRLLRLAEGDTIRTWTMLMGIAVAYEELEQEREALEYFNRLLLHIEDHGELLTIDWAKRRQVAMDRVAAHEATLLQKKGLYKVRTRPAGAQVFVDGVPQGIEGDLRTPCKLYLSPGTREIRLEHAGFEAVSTSARIELGQRDGVLVTLKEVPGILLARTGDASAVVFVDGSRVGSGADVRAEVAPGAHEVKVRRSGYRPYTGQIHVVSGQELPLEVGWEGLEGSSADSGGLVPLRGHADAELPQLWGYLAMGVGGGCLLVGAIFHGLAVGTVKDMESLDREQGREAALDEWKDLDGELSTRRAVAGSFYGVGATAVLGGATYLLFFAEDAPWSVWTAGAAAPSLSLQALGEGSLVNATWRW